VTYRAESLLTSCLIDAHLAVKIPTFKENKVYFPCSLHSDTGPYPQPGKSSPHIHIQLLNIHFNIILSFTPGILTQLFSADLADKILHAFAIILFVLHEQLTSCSLTRIPHEHDCSVQFIKTPNYAIFPIVLLYALC